VLTDTEPDVVTCFDNTSPSLQVRETHTEPFIQLHMFLGFLALLLWFILRAVRNT